MRLDAPSPWARSQGLLEHGLSPHDTLTHLRGDVHGVDSHGGLHIPQYVGGEAPLKQLLFGLNQFFAARTYAVDPPPLTDHTEGKISILKRPIQARIVLSGDPSRSYLHSPLLAILRGELRDHPVVEPGHAFSADLQIEAGQLLDAFCGQIRTLSLDDLLGDLLADYACQLLGGLSAFPQNGVVILDGRNLESALPIRTVVDRLHQLAEIVSLRLLLPRGPSNPVVAVLGRPSQHPLEGQLMPSLLEGGIGDASLNDILDNLGAPYVGPRSRPSIRLRFCLHP